MYCRNCGSNIDDKAVVCVHCGCRPIDGTKYCPKCGAATSEEQIVCLNCGCSLKKEPIVESKRNMYVAALLALFLGTIGIHDFYLGYTKQGVIKIILTVTAIGSVISVIWSIVDLVKILTGEKKDADGYPLSKNF